MLPLLVTLLTIAATECAAWLLHKYVLHGPLWFVHRTHHEPHKGWFEWNDLIILPYAIGSAWLCIWGSLHNHWVLWVGVGIGVYGALYFLLHDVLVHQRIKIKMPVKGYLWRLVRAHKRHHKHLNRDGSEAFGFLYAHPRYQMRNEKVKSKNMVH